jgi:hypothetical protein
MHQRRPEVAWEEMQAINPKLNADYWEMMRDALPEGCT